MRGIGINIMIKMIIEKEYKKLIPYIECWYIENGEKEENRL